MLKTLTVSNYRAFLDPARLEIRKLTLLYGRNNVGKSSLARLLPLLRDSTRHSARAPVDLSSEVVRGASFEDLATRPPLGSRLAIRFGLDFVLPGGRQASLDLKARFVPEDRKQWVEEIRAELTPDFGFEGRWNLEGSAVPGGALTFESAQNEGGAVQLKFQGLLPYEGGSAPANPSAWAALSDGIRSSLAGIDWLGAIRERPLRQVNVWTDTAERIGESGKGFQEALATDWLNGREVFDRVRQFLAEKLRQHLAIEADGKEYGIFLGPAANPGLRVNLVDCGEGMAQVLPVLVALESARRDRPGQGILVLEQPELHLHTDAQVALAEHLCLAASDPAAPALVIETHSETFLWSLQQAILADRLDPSHVGLYWVDQYEDGRALLSQAILDEDGRTTGWPARAFAERTDQARAVLLARRQKVQG